MISWHNRDQMYKKGKPALENANLIPSFIWTWVLNIFGLCKTTKNLIMQEGLLSSDIGTRYVWIHMFLFEGNDPEVKAVFLEKHFPLFFY